MPFQSFLLIFFSLEAHVSVVSLFALVVCCEREVIIWRKRWVFFLVSIYSFNVREWPQNKWDLRKVDNSKSKIPDSWKWCTFFTRNGFKLTSKIKSDCGRGDERRCGKEKQEEEKRQRITWFLLFPLHICGYRAVIYCKVTRIPTWVFLWFLLEAAEEMAFILLFINERKREMKKKAKKKDFCKKNFHSLAGNGKPTPPKKKFFSYLHMLRRSDTVL